MMRRSGAIGPPVRYPLLVGLLFLVSAGAWGQSGGGMSAAAADEAIRWYVIAGGGVIGSTNGSNTLSGTVGQGIIGRVTNSTGVVFQGFWVPPTGTASVDNPGSPVVAGTRTRLRNYPNPFSSSTTIAFHVGERSRVRLEVFNRLGQSVKILVDDLRDAGDYSELWDGLDPAGARAPSGGYLYRITVQPLGPIGSESFSEQNQMMIVR